MYRQDKLGALQRIEELTTRYRLKIRILTPFDDSINQLAQELRKYDEIRYIPEELQTKITIAIIERKWSIVVELKDDSKDSSYEAMGFELSVEYILQLPAGNHFSLTHAHILVPLHSNAYHKI